MRLLIVDDSRLDRTRIKRLINQMNAEVSVAEAQDVATALGMVAVDYVFKRVRQFMNGLRRWYVGSLRQIAGDDRPTLHRQTDQNTPDFCPRVGHGEGLSGAKRGSSHRSRSGLFRSGS